MTKEYLCYGCNKVFHSEDLAYDCMCFHPNEEVNYRGICKECIEQNREVKIPEQHILVKIHTYSEEYHKFWKEIHDTYPDYTGLVLKKDGIEINYYESPIGERGMQIFNALISQGVITEAQVEIPENWNIYKKTAFIPIAREKLNEINKCNCCKN